LIKFTQKTVIDCDWRWRLPYVCLLSEEKTATMANKCVSINGWWWNV